MPGVSVVIPTYNRSRFVLEAIDSVLKQTYGDFELIVVDDGSTDNTRELVSNIKDSRLRYIYQENQGVSGALNTGILASAAGYIAILASDNIIFEDALEKCVSFMDGHPEVGFCHGQNHTMDGKGRMLRSKKVRGPRVTSIGDCEKEMVALLLGDSTTRYFMVRRSCFDTVGLFNTGLRMSEDWDMLFRLARLYPVGHLAEPLGIVRNHEQSMTSKVDVEIVKQAHTAVLESVFSDAKLGPLYRHLRRRAYFGLYCLLARTAARTGHRFKGLLYLLSAIRISPQSIFRRQGLLLLINSSRVFLPGWLGRAVVRALIALKMR